jgi:hypothetical protein
MRNPAAALPDESRIQKPNYRIQKPGSLVELLDGCQFLFSGSFT